MGYVKQSFVDGKTILSASHLKHIEDGIVQLEKNISGSTSSSVESNYWRGKKMVVNGDSIPAGSALTNVSDAFPTVLANMLGMSLVNYSIGGTTIGKPKDSYEECYVSKEKWNEAVNAGKVDTSKKYLVNLGTNAPRVFQIMSYKNGSWTGGGTASTSAARTPLVDRIAAMDKDADVVIIMCGSNDFYYNWVPFGSFDTNNYRNSGIPEAEMSGNNSSDVVITPDTDLGESLVKGVSPNEQTSVGSATDYSVTPNQTEYYSFINIPVIGGHTLYIPNSRRGWFLNADADPISTVNFGTEVNNFTYKVPAEAAYLSISFKYSECEVANAAVYQISPEIIENSSEDTGKGPNGLKETYYDAMHTLCRYILNTYKNKDIFFCTPIKRVQHVGESNGTWNCVFPEDKNTEQKTLKDFRDAMIEVCEYYSIPCIDLYSTSGLNPHIDPDMFADKDGKHTHPTKEGHKRLASVIAAYMNANRK